MDSNWCGLCFSCSRKRTRFGIHIRSYEQETEQVFQQDKRPGGLGPGPGFYLDPGLFFPTNITSKVCRTGSSVCLDLEHSFCVLTP